MADAAILVGSRALLATLIALMLNGAARAEPPRLSGIVIAGEERVAIFAGKSGEAMLAVREGDSVGDERVAAIDARGVRLGGPAGTRLITLDADSSTRAALATTVPRPPLIDPYWRERETESDQ